VTSENFKGNISILIVIRESVIALELKSILMGLGYNICGVIDNGEEALELMEQDHPDLVLIDTALKGSLDGIETAEAIRHISITPIILLTSPEDIEILEKAKLIDPFLFLTKPVRVQDLKLTIDMVLHLAEVERERKQNVQEAIKQEKYLLTILNTTQDGFWIVNAEGRFQDVNDAYCAMSGYTRDEFLRLSINDIDADEHPEQTSERIKRIIINGSEIFETRHRRKDGSVFEVEVSTTYLQENGGLLICFCRSISDRKRREEAIEAERAIMDTILSNLNTGLSLINPDLTIAWVNDKVRDMFPKGEPIGRKCHQYYENNPAPCSFCGTISSFNDGQTYVVDRYNSDDQCWYKIISLPIKDKKGQVIQVIESISDITDRKNAEEALRESEERFRTIYENAPIGIARVSLDFQIEGANKAYCRMLGYTEDELIGKSIKELTHPDDLEENQSVRKDLLDGKINHIQMEKRHIHKSGRIINSILDSTLVRDKEGYPQYTFGCLTDVTELKKIENALRESAQRMELAIEGGDLGTWDWDVTTGKVIFNERWARMLGYDLEEIKPDITTWETLIHPDDASFAMNNLTEHLDGKTDYYEAEHRLKHKSGDWVWVLDKGKVIERDINGNPRRVCGTHLDITKRKHSEEQVSAMLEASQSVLLCPDFQESARRIFDVCCRVTGAVSGYVALMSADGAENEVLFLESGGMPCDVNPEIPMPIRGLRAEAYRKAEVVYDNDFMNSDWVRFMPGGHVNLKNVMFAPLILKSTVVGVIGLANKPGDFTPSDAEIAASLGDIAAIALYRSRAEEALRESEERYRILAEHMPVLVNAVTKEGVFTFWNRTCEEVTGYTNDEIIGNPNALSLLYPDQHYRDSLSSKWQEQGYFFENMEITMQSKQGKALYIIWSNLPPQGTFSKEATWAIGIDITDRRYAEKALRDSEERFRTIYNRMAVGVSRISLDFHIESVNAAYCSMFGYTEDELIGKHIKDITHPDSSNEYIHKLADLVQGKIDHYRIERQFVHKDGHKVYVILNSNLIRDHEGNPQYALGNVLDITDRKKAEEEREKLLTVIQNSNSIVKFKDRDLRNIMVNQAYLKLTGHKSLEDVIGKIDQELLKGLATDDEIRNFMDNDRKAMALPRGQRIRVEETLSGENGEVRIFDTRKFPIYDDTGEKLLGVAMLATEITEQKRAEEEKEKLEAQLQQAQKMEAVGTLAGGVAHDFNNLLQAINGYTQLLMMDKTPEDEDYKSLKAIWSSGNRAARLVQQLLQFSRKAEPERRTIDLNSEIEHARKLLERTLPKMIDIRLQLAGRLWNVHADPIQIEQMLLNLGTNAADAMPDGGILFIETKNVVIAQKDAPPEQLTLKPGNYVMVNVQDTGHGMSKETVTHIFDPFFTTKEIGKGTGLGLASVYGIVKGHGGTITCYSEIGQGTVFRIYLPALQQEETNIDGEIIEKTSRGGTETILLVDDEETIRDFASRMLKSTGYQVLTASSGEEALNVYKTVTEPIDLVIMDLGMPGMGGHRCLLELIKVNPKVKVVIASGYSYDAQVKRSMEAGAVGYIGKPYEMAELLKTARSVFDGGE
jgi:PAS domain S-box-containing protein